MLVNDVKVLFSMSVFLKMVLILQASASILHKKYRRNDGFFRPTNQGNKAHVEPTDNYDDLMKKMAESTTAGGGAGNMANRYAVITTTTTVKRRTTPRRVSLEEECDYLAYYCLKAYKTGKVCGRTMYYNYQDFKNYCMLDYVNCMERYEVWQIVHMGECFNVSVLKEYQHYEYHDDFFLDQTYVIQE